MIMIMKQRTNEWCVKDMEYKFILNEVKTLGFMDNGTGQHQSNTVYDGRYICPTVTTVNGGGTQQIKVMVINNELINRWNASTPKY